MRSTEEKLMRRLCLTLTTVVLLCSVITIYALQWLPNEPLHLRRNITVYSMFVLFVSAAGFVGAIKRDPTLLTLFSSHLLLDSILYLIPRILVLNFSISLPSLFCTPPTHPPSRSDGAYRVFKNPHLAERFLESERCRTITWTLEGCLVSVMVMAMGLQLWLALKIRRYAHYLEEMERQAERLGELRMAEKDVC